MRNIKGSYSQLLKVKDKQQNVITKLKNMNVLTNELRQNILAVKSSDELDHLVYIFLCGNYLGND